jgi:hypothetical protein
MAQRDKVIHHTIYISDINQQVPIHSLLSS